MDIDFALFRQVADNLNDERNVAARFYDKAVKTENLSAEGLPVFKNVTYVEIRLKDNNTEVFNQPATAEKIKRFPKEYALYKLAKEKTKDGTPLNQFAFLSAAEIATCQNRGVFTVEDLAALDEQKAQSLGLSEERLLAETFVRQAKSNAKIADFAEKEEAYKKEIEKLKAENIELKQYIDRLSKSKTLSKRMRNKGEMS